MNMPPPFLGLAIHGGTPVITDPLTPFHSLGEEEAIAAAEVVRAGVLSGFIGAPGEAFLGGPRVRQLEQETAQYFGVRHAVAVNSWTSGLIAAVGAIGLEPGDEVITTPWTMAATATAILHWAGIPVFADIDPVTFNINPTCVEQLISPRTRAILAVDIFGQSANMPALRDIADRHRIKLLSDTAQAPGALANGRYAGSLADIGGYSLNYHKHIHCGEGGLIVTNDADLAERLQRLRNHAECVMPAQSSPEQLSNMLGYNFRLGEIEAAIASIQLRKLASRIESRQRAAAQLTEGLRGLPGLTPPTVLQGNTHVYYVYGVTLDTRLLGVPRPRLVEALRAEGVSGLFEGYQNIHRLPLFQHQIAYGRGGFPWTSPYASRSIDYSEGSCPVAEELHGTSFMGLNLCMHEYPPRDIERVVAAFHKVWAHLDALRQDDAHP